jgi:hypothetical protein
MTDPYRSPAEVLPEPPAEPTPPAPFPGPWKWSNALWRSFFDRALAGCAGHANLFDVDYPLGESADVYAVNRAVNMADEAWRRAFAAGAPDANVPIPESTTPKRAVPGPWFLARCETRPGRVAIRVDGLGTFDVAYVEEGGASVKRIERGVAATNICGEWIPTEAVDVVQTSDFALVWTVADYETVFAEAYTRGDEGRAKSFGRCARRLRITSLPDWS